MLLMNIRAAVRSMSGSPLFWVAAFLSVGSPLHGVELGLFKPKPKPETAEKTTTARLREIDQATKGFADRYVTYLSDSCEKVEKNNADPEARRQAQRLKLFTSSSVYGIAASPNPLGQLLDLCVVVTLQRTNWVEEGRAKKVFGEDHCHAVIETFNNAHTEVWALAARFLTAAEINETQKLIRQWRAAHKDLSLLPYVRFDDFARARAGLDQQNPVVKGLFSQITEASHSIQTATDLGERSLYYFERMPRLLQWETERTLQALLENPQLQQHLASFERISNTVAEELKKLDERQAEVQKTLDELNQVALNGKSLLMEARTTGDTLTQASTSLTETFRTFEHLVHTLNPPPVPGEIPKPGGKPFDITEYGAVFERATATAREARLLIDASLQLESAPAFNSRVAEVEAFTERRTNHMALRGAQLIVFFFAMLFFTRWFSARCFGHPSAKGNDPRLVVVKEKTSTGTDAHVP